MKYEYGGSSPKYYATDLHMDTEHGTLQWVCGRGQEVLLVRTPFGTHAEDYMEDICREMERTPPETGKFTKSGGQTAVRFVTAAERVRHSGCVPDANGCTYTVFPCMREGSLCRIFSPARHVVTSPRYDIPMTLHVEVFPLTEYRGMIRKVETPTGYYRIAFSPDWDQTYPDGGLEYRCGDFRVPITRRMFEAGEIFVKSEEVPVIAPRRSGIALA